jgi:Fur family transcriptional regulator, ferric uptake regulator
MKKATEVTLASAIASIGGRLTKQREEIYALLKTHKEPVTISTLAQRADANEVSVYRTISLFKETGLIEEIAYPDGSRRYALGDHHHHHVICSRCGYTEHVPCDKRDVSTSMKYSRFNQIDGHEVTYYGTCVACT